MPFMQFALLATSSKCNSHNKILQRSHLEVWVKECFMEMLDTIVFQSHMVKKRKKLRIMVNNLSRKCLPLLIRLPPTPMMRSNVVGCNFRLKK